MVITVLATIGSADWFTEIGLIIATFGLRLLGAIAIFFLGKWLAKQIKKGIITLLTRAKLEETLVSFISNILHALMLVLLVISILGLLGIETTSFVAVIGAASFAVAMAFKDSLSSLSAGVLLVIFKPFKIGDSVEISGVNGTIKEINIFTTTLATPDNKQIIIPNHKITADKITNFTAYANRRIDLVIGISYEDSMREAKEIIHNVIQKDERIFTDPATVIAVTELGESSVNITVRTWVKREHYFVVMTDLLQTIKETFDEKGISIPFPQRDIHMISNQEIAKIS